MKDKIEEISIIDDSRLIDIQGKFSMSYPYLMIEFFQLEKFRKSFQNTKIDSRTSVKQLTYPVKTYKININAAKTVSELVNELQSVLNVDVHMCRKSGNVWNRISVTSEWTLEEQNTAGAFISSEMLKNGA
jgi:hypothetical protein